MKRALFPFLLGCFIVLQSGTSVNPSIKDDNLLVGVFDGRTPCQDLAKQLNQPTIPECTKIKWRLILHKDPLSDNTGTYALEGFVFRKENILKGKWHLTKGTKANPEAIVYQLDNKERGTLFLQKADDNVLFFLDRQKNIMVGNESFSYTLNRTTDPDKN